MPRRLPVRSCLFASEKTTNANLVYPALGLVRVVRGAMIKRWVVCSLVLLVLYGCTRVPEGVEPVAGFNLEQYLGTWYEIARLDHSFEKDLVDVTADYALRDDGGIRVTNRGRNTRTGEWEEANGKAYFLDAPDSGSLKVSFFGPFYGGYHIARLDTDYRMALVVGPTLEYAWILARTSEPDKALCDEFLTAAQQLGIERDLWIRIRNCR